MPWQKGMSKITIDEVERRAKRVGFYFERFSGGVFIMRTNPIESPWTFSGLLSKDHKDDFSQTSIYAAMDLIFREEESRDTHI